MLKRLELDIGRIKDLYVNQKKTIKEVAKILRVSTHPIQDRLEEMNIKIRKGSEYKIIELDSGKIRNLYVNQKLSALKIARSLK